MKYLFSALLKVIGMWFIMMDTILIDKKYISNVSFEYKPQPKKRIDKTKFSKLMQRITK